MTKNYDFTACLVLAAAVLRSHGAYAAAIRWLLMTHRGGAVSREGGGNE